MVVILGVFIPANTGSSLCVQSVLQLTPGVVLCGSATSSLQGVQYGSIWLTGANAVQVTSSSPTITFYYQLGNGLSLTSFSADWCTSSTMNNYVCPDGSPTLTVTNNGVQSSGIGSFTAVAPSMGPGATYYFEGHIKDSSGAGYSSVGAVAYVQTSYSITVGVTDLQTGLALSGAQVNLFVNGGGIYATQTTVGGSTTFNVPFNNDGYYAVVSATSYTPVTTAVILTGPPSQTVTVKMESTDLATITESTFLEMCTTTLSNGQTTTITFTATTIYLTSTGGSSTFAQSSGSNPCTTTATPPPGPSSSLSLDFPVIIIGAVIMVVGAFFPETGTKKKRELTCPAGRAPGRACPLRWSRPSVSPSSLSGSGPTSSTSGRGRSRRRALRCATSGFSAPRATSMSRATTW